MRFKEKQRGSKRSKEVQREAGRINPKQRGNDKKPENLALASFVNAEAVLLVGLTSM